MGKIFKKILLLFVTLLMFYPCFADKISEKRYAIHDTCTYYDLGTYKYNTKNDTYSIDILLDLDPMGDGLNPMSPYEKARIYYVIVGTKYYHKTGQIKIWYKGFVSLEYDYKENRDPQFIAKNVKFYYEPYNYKIYNDRGWTYITAMNIARRDKNPDGYKKYVEDVTGDFLKAYKKGKLLELGSAGL